MKSRLDKHSRDTLRSFHAQIDADSPFFIGFPGSVDFDYSELTPFFRYLLNNVGDPYEDPLHTNHSKHFEKEVINFFADMFRAPKNDRWGYVTNGGTEGNLYALYLARALHPKGVVYYTTSAHYSIPKNVQILAMESVVVESQPNGEMDYKDFRKKVSRNRKRPAIIVATIGTTMTEAKDSVYIIRKILGDYSMQDVFVHCDAALAGVYTEYMLPHHPFDFADGADSISISGHKFIGSPMACGVVITRKSYRDRVVRDSLYVGSPDSTISGSRNGHTPLMLWYTIKKLGVDGLYSRALKSMELARYLHTELQYIGWTSWKNENSFTVVIKKPPDAIVHKWQLATYGEWSHIVCMPGVIQGQLDKFVDDLKRSKHYK